MSDIANAIYRHLRTMAPHQLERLTAIQLKEAADEIARLTLTDEEREAIKAGIANCEDITYGGPNDKEAAAVLRRLLERLG